MYISKIVSGGQTGVDRGALEAALKAQFPYGGMIPKGRLAEDGSVPEKFTCMDVADSEDYRFRTRWNVEHSDATLILTFGEELEGGTQRRHLHSANPSFRSMRRSGAQTDWCQAPLHMFDC